ncbi:MAG: diguanylate cyclase [Chloroflexi bacterium]|nr:diguanylate cyclase [Chloroflexota bacterium]
MLASSVSTQSVIVLVIDPEPVNQRTMRDQLVRLGYAARLADDYESARSIVEATPPDIVLVPGLTAYGKGWSELQTQLNSWGIPLLKLGEGRKGAITGPLTPPAISIGDADLKMRLEDAVKSRDMFKALVIENTRLSAERLHDALTGLFNRRYIMIRVEEEVKRSSRRAYPLSCLLLDVDKFDQVNDRWGHSVGDAVLRDVAHVMTRTMRATDVVARYRNDQFLVLLTDTDSDGAQIAANRLRDSVADHNFYNQTSADAVKLTASVGVAYWQPSSKPGEGVWEPQLIALAERALRAAKLSGPNRLVMLQAA